MKGAMLGGAPAAATGDSVKHDFWSADNLFVVNGDRMMKGVVWATVTVEVTIFTLGVGSAWLAAGTGGTLAGGGAATAGAC